jgi:diguanylate cyclase (GGDEF)-like protein
MSSPAENINLDNKISVLEESPICSKIIDLNSRLQYMSTAGVNSLHIENIEDYYGHTYPLDFYDESIRESLTEHLDKAKKGEVSSVECLVVSKDGTEIWYHTTFIPSRDENDQIRYIIASSVDNTEAISERKELEAKLHYMASHDSLTGLYNRHVLEDRLEYEIKRSTRYQHSLSVLMIDIDHFKRVNDTYGHHIGDLVLQGFAKRLEASIRNSDYISRYGGEEFVAVLPETPTTEAKELAERIRREVSEHPFPIENKLNISLTISIGISTLSDHCRTKTELITAADFALYASKKAGRNQIKTNLID